MDFVDICEDLAHEWGKYPQEIARMPWFHLKRWLPVHAKRKRREFKLQAALARMGMGSIFGGGAEAAPEEIGDQDRTAALKSMGFTVETRKVD